MGGVAESGAAEVWCDRDRGGRFTVLTGIAGAAWVPAAAAMAKRLDVPLAAVVIGPGRDVDDLYCDWADRREVQESGAVLVRPDKDVGLLSDDLPDDPEEALMSALRAILHRSA